MDKLKIYYVKLNRPCDIKVNKAFQSAGVNIIFTTELDPHSILVKAKDIKQLTDLDYVSEAKLSGIAKIY